MCRRTELRWLRSHHLDFAAQLHQRTLPHGFFPRLGRRWLRAYYRTFIESPHGVALVAIQGDEPVGVLVGTVSNAAHRAWVLRHHGPRLAALGLAALVTRPSVAMLFVRTRARRYARQLLRLDGRPWPATSGSALGASPGSGQVRGAGFTEPRDLAVLSHLSVVASARGGGAGRMLVEAFARRAEHAGSPEAMLVTLASAAGARRFYERLGWTRVHDRPGHDGRKVSVFSLKFDRDRRPVRGGL